MDFICWKNASGKSWMAIVIIFGVIYLAGMVSAQAGFDRLTSENTVGVYDSLPNFAKLGGNDVAGQKNGEISGTVKERHKRLSDQRRAELETLMALSKMTGKLVNVIRGGRQLEASKNGRMKRSVFDLNVKNLQRLFRLSGKLGYKGNAAFPVLRLWDNADIIGVNKYFAHGGALNDKKKDDPGLNIKKFGAPIRHGKL